MKIYLAGSTTILISEHYNRNLESGRKTTQFDTREFACVCF